MVFVVTIWEAYVEDLVVEAATHIAQHSIDFDALPRTLKRIITNGVRGDPPKWIVADVAGEGWRKIVVQNAEQRAAGRDFNTPKTANVKDLVADAIGLDDVTSSWGWQKFAAPNPGDRLDETIEIRGDIVHTGRKPDGLNKAWIGTYGNNIQKLVDKTDLAVRRHAMKVTGIAMADVAAID